MSMPYRLIFDVRETPEEHDHIIPTTTAKLDSIVHLDDRMVGLVVRGEINRDFAK